jgi:taurine dioxygenase
LQRPERRQHDDYGKKAGVLGVEPIHPTIGAIVSGVDATQPLDEETVHYVRQALLDYKVVFLRNQHLDIEEQTRFAEYFGDLYEHPIGSDYPDLEWLKEQGHSTRAVYWHSDVSSTQRCGKRRKTSS